MTNDTKGDALADELERMYYETPDGWSIRPSDAAYWVARHRAQILSDLREVAQLRKANDQLFAHGESMFRKLQALRTRLVEAERLLDEADSWLNAAGCHDMKSCIRAFLATAPTPEASAGGANPSNQTE